MKTAASANTARHPATADSAPPTTRPSSRPIMMPLTTVPTDRPRSAGGDIAEAKGTSCCGTQHTIPRANEAASSIGRLAAAAESAANTQASAIWPSTRRLRSKRSPRGSRVNTPHENPASVKPGMRPIDPSGMPRSAAISGSIGWL